VGPHDHPRHSLEGKRKEKKRKEKKRKEKKRKEKKRKEKKRKGFSAIVTGASWGSSPKQPRGEQA